MLRRWLVNRTNAEYVRYLSRSASISPIFARVLINRGIKTSADINDFLSQGITGLSDPFELPGMRAAIERIKEAVTRGDRVLVHGDYDTDGLTAAAIMVYTLRCLGLDVHYFIPNRTVHGYGFTADAVLVAKRLGARLIITVDCGITSFDAAGLARKEGIDVVITDHHEPHRKPDVVGGKQEVPDKFLIPDAVAVVNPKLRVSDSRLSILSGAGVAFKLAQAAATEGSLRFSSEDCLSLLDLAAIGTVADVVPVTGENRILVKEGLRSISSSRRAGIRALKEVCGLGSREIRAGLLAFTVVPRINAAGRIADSRDVVRLLLSEDDGESQELSAWLDGLNAERQKIEERVYEQALAKVETSDMGAALVLAGEGWHQGVLGIVASRVAEEFGRPAFIFSVDNGIAKGSARSIPSFDICKGLAGCEGLLLSFGGHRQAAGIRLKAENIPDFVKTINEIIMDNVGEDDLLPSLEIDADISLSEVTHSLVRELAMLEPLGYGNPEPLFGSRGLEVVNPRIVGKNHLKMKLRKSSHSVDTIGFDMGTVFEDLAFPSRLDVVFTPGINEWNGSRYLQIVLKAFRPAL